jgi:hypothetical protein
MRKGIEWVHTGAEMGERWLRLGAKWVRLEHEFSIDCFDLREKIGSFGQSVFALGHLGLSAAIRPGRFQD